ncbi:MULTISPECIES: sialidase family protein [Niastella]|uniref:exo-alpha-sialidase n=1 Tax=Niastella soli TaxID=2821487 RepID=A0ABS3YUH9_9BACT|nr:sialidase family protein [Niastella soli]MBO9201545.1 exo-alpha-sialidase [Niastella soli]
MKQTTCPGNTRINQLSRLFTIITVIALSATACKKGIASKKTTDDERGATTEATQTHTYIKLFDGGTDGYHSFRIPSIVRTNDNTLLAFVEGRMGANKDYGNINVEYKRSTDNGSTWSAMMEVVGAGQGTWGNPTSVVDRNTGRIWVFMSWNSATKNQGGTDGYEKIDTWGDRKVYYSYSDDDGLTFTTPTDMTSTLLPSGYTWDAMGPGVGIQTTNGTLVIPAIGRNIYSTDHGATWHYQLIPGGTSEGTIVELNDGRLMRNDRATSTTWATAKRRWVSRGTITGSFSAFAPDDVLLDPACEGSTVRYTGSPDRIMVLNSASTETRCKMRVRISYDGGVTWPLSRKIYDWLTDDEAFAQGKGGYSSMVKTADYTIGALIEINENTGDSPNSHRSIEFHKFNLPWMTSGATEPLP